MSATKVSLIPDSHDAGGAGKLIAAGLRPAGDPAEQRLSARPPVSAARSRLQLQVFGTLADIGPAWRSFEREADRTAFQSFDWLAAWQHHIGERCGTAASMTGSRSSSCSWRST